MRDSGNKRGAKPAGTEKPAPFRFEDLGIADPGPIPPPELEVSEEVLEKLKGRRGISSEISVPKP
ncbi:MAG TPA: hypothetical protein VF618_22860 [Thermoanaerobaculia bacterium]